MKYRTYKYQGEWWIDIKDLCGAGGFPTERAAISAIPRLTAEAAEAATIPSQYVECFQQAAAAMWIADICAALAASLALVRSEFPSKYTFAEIAATWGDSNAAGAAIRRIERALGAKTLDCLIDQLRERSEIERPEGVD